MHTIWDTGIWLWDRNITIKLSSKGKISTLLAKFILCHFLFCYIWWAQDTDAPTFRHKNLWNVNISVQRLEGVVWVYLGGYFGYKGCWNNLQGIIWGDYQSEYEIISIYPNGFFEVYPTINLYMVRSLVGKMRVNLRAGSSFVMCVSL